MGSDVAELPGGAGAGGCLDGGVMPRAMRTGVKMLAAEELEAWGDGSGGGFCRSRRLRWKCSLRLFPLPS